MMRVVVTLSFSPYVCSKGSSGSASWSGDMTRDKVVSDNDGSGRAPALDAKAKGDGGMEGSGGSGKVGRGGAHGGSGGGGGILRHHHHGAFGVFLM